MSYKNILFSLIKQFMKKFIIKFSLLLAIFFLVGLPAKAASQEERKMVWVKADEIVTTSIYALADEVIVDGSINGDLVTIAKKITVNGQIEGDLIAMAPEINVNGPIDGNIRIASENFNLNSPVSRNLNILATKINLGENSRVFWDAYLIGKNISVAGKIDGSLEAFAEKTIVSGEVGKNADIKLYGDKKESINLKLSGAVINGDLAYRSNIPAEVDSSSNIAGEIYPDLTQSNKSAYTQNVSWVKLTYKIISALIFGFLIIIFGKKHLDGLFNKIKSEPKKIIIPALIIFFITPLGVIISFITIIGIPLSLVLLVLWLILQYLARVLIMIFFGQLLIKFFKKEKSFHIAWALVLGVIISYLLFSLPLIGGLLSWLASLTGLGAIYLYVTNKPRSV